MALFRRMDDGDPIARPAGEQEERRAVDTGLLTTGTLACPVCDAPVAPGPRPLSPAEWMACPFCTHAGAVREFLTLGEPSRPARVDVRVVRRSAAR